MLLLIFLGPVLFLVGATLLLVGLFRRDRSRIIFGGSVVLLLGGVFYLFIQRHTHIFVVKSDVPIEAAHLSLDSDPINQRMSNPVSGLAVTVVESGDNGGTIKIVKDNGGMAVCRVGYITGGLSWLLIYRVSDEECSLLMDLP